jgi:hypothetical protein
VVEVDPTDDAIDRWIVTWYRFDPERHERRHTIVVAFDNTAEMEAEMARLNHQLRDRKRAGSSDDVEWISAVFQHAGYKEDMAAQRLAWDVLRRLGRLPQGWCE